MSNLDWSILILTILFIVLFGVWKSRGSRNISGFLLGNKEAKWWTVGLSVMATQASAITFLSTPGQAFDDGMGFVQFYFGLPLAMIVLCYTFIPIYHRLKVYTAYEFLENRFDLKTRSLAAILFLIQRGLGAGITIYAPAIILSTVLGWNLRITTVVIGILVIVYTVAGGTKAVNVTQKFQMGIIFLGMFIVFGLLLSYLPEGISFVDSLRVAGATGKMQVVDFSVDLESRYTFWSGITGGFFIALAYFGTDQSQVQRYLSGSSIRESRMGLIFNGMLKVPMQFFILLVGIMVFVFYQFNSSPIFFNPFGLEELAASERSTELVDLETRRETLHLDRQQLYRDYLSADDAGNASLESEIKEQIQASTAEDREIRDEVKSMMNETLPHVETNDRDYVFISFILNHLPKGLIGLLLAVILSAAMSSTAAELNALASTTTIDIYKRSVRQEASDTHYLRAGQGFTLMWGLIAILFASIGTLFENLIQFVNIVGSIFYGTVLGIFLVAFYFKSIGGRAVFTAAVMSQITVIVVFQFTDIGYLWFNVIGCFGVIILSFLLQPLLGKPYLKVE